MNETIISDIGKMIVFLLFLFAIFLITKKTKRKLPNYLFSAFLLVTAIDLSGLFLISKKNEIIESFIIASVLLQMPLYYLYVKSACYYNFKLNKMHLIHGVLFVIFLSSFLLTNISENTLIAFKIITTIQYYYYIIAVFISLINFKKLYQENYSSNHYLIYKWLRDTTVLFLVGNSLSKAKDLIPFDTTILGYLNIFTSIFALFVICWFVLNALYKPTLFIGIDIGLDTVKFTEDQKSEPEQLKKLRDYMITEKPYLDDKLSLAKLAGDMEISEKELSVLINKFTEKHFFDFINSYRIDYARQLLKENKELTVLEIVYQVGFNSKSSFYTAFKKETDTTPTMYRKSVV